MPGEPLTVDKPLNARQERFCQLVASGMSLNAACLAAGYKRTASVYLLVRKPNVRARIEALQAEAATLNLISKPQITQRILGFVDKAEAGGSAAMLREGRQGLMDVAKLNGLVSALPPAPKPAPPKREPVTEIRRTVVYPDGYETDYSGNPVDPHRPPYDPSFRYRREDKEP